MTDITQEMIEEHSKAKAMLDKWKRKEMDARLAICDVLLKGKTEGTHTFHMHGNKVKAVRKYNYGLDQASIANMIEDEELSKEELDLIRTKYELKLGDYKKHEGDLTNLESALTISDATPTLTIEIDD